MIAFGKIFQTLVSPLPICFLLILASLFVAKRNKRLASILFYVGLGSGLLFSNHWIACLLLNRLETPFPSKNYDSYPNSEVAVVLGGSLVSYLPGRQNLEENSASRLVPAYLLYKSGKTGKIIVSGGNPYFTEAGIQRAEADDMADFLVVLGVPKNAIIKEGLSRNTEENALEVSKILRLNGWERPLLVTTAFHMKRAQLFFEKNGVSILPVAVGHRASTDVRAWYLNFIPAVGALDMSAITLKEHLGYLWALLKS